MSSLKQENHGNSNTGLLMVSKLVHVSSKTRVIKGLLES
jgi:hypothetical protein